MFELLQEIATLFFEKVEKKALGSLSKFIGYNKIKTFIRVISKYKNLSNIELYNELVNKNLIGRFKISQYLQGAGLNGKNAKQALSNLFLENNAKSINRDIETFNKEYKESAINIIVVLRSSWVRAGKWVPSYATGISSKASGVMSIWTKTGSKEYIFPNISSANWIEITSEWITPFGHGAGSFLWDKKLLARAGANIKRKFSTTRKKFKSAFNPADQILIQQKNYITRPRILARANERIIRKNKRGLYRVLPTTNASYRQLNKFKG